MSAEPVRSSDDARQRLQTSTLMRLASSRVFEQGELLSALRELCESAAGALDVDRASVWLFADDDSRLIGVDAFDARARRHEVPDDLYPAAFPVYFRALYEHRSIAADDAPSDPRMCEFAAGYFAQLGIRSSLDAPIRLGQRVLGVVCFETIRARRVWSSDDEQFSGSLAGLASLAIEASRLREARSDLIRKNRELAILHRIFQIALSDTRLDDALQAMAREISAALSLSHVALQLFDESSATLARPAAIGWNLGAELEATPLARALGGAVVSSGAVLALEGPRLAAEAHPELAGLRLFLAAPMRLADRTIGVLALGSAEEREPDVELLGLVSSLADALATQVDRYRSIESARRLEECLRESQKLESLGTLAGGIAHDFNNLLTGILGHAQMLRASATPGDDAYRSVEIIVGAAERAAELTQQLLGFARQGKQRDVACDVHALIRDVCKLAVHTLPKNVTVEQDLAAREFVVIGDPGQLHQALLNLVLNARDALHDGGRLVLATRDVDPGELRERPGRERARGPHLCISVGDTGSGIAEEHLHRVFEPFFTTKEPGKGSGMGLAMVHGIVEAHDGSIEVESHVGRGTTFRVYLPIALDAHSPSALPRPTEPVHGTGHVLVVDDDPLVAEVATELVRSYGYTVTTASSGAEAIERYLQARPRIDLVLLDLVMPRMGGRECLRALRRIDPSSRIVISSGWQSSGIVQELTGDGALDFVRKPYESTQLSDVIARAIATRT